MSAAPPDPATTPRPGSLEHLADRRPDEVVLIDAGDGRTLTRAAHDAGADALADGLATRFAVAADAQVAVQLPPGPELLTVLPALAKLGAAPVLLDPGLPAAAAATLATAAGCVVLVGGLGAGDAHLPHLPATALGDLAAAHEGAPRRFSGAHVPAEAIACAAGRLVVRRRSPERVARMAVPVGDLLARVGLTPGGVHLLGTGAHRPEPQFWAGVTLVTGGTVVTCDSPEPAALLAALGEHQVASAVLDGTTLRALVTLPPALTDEADLTALERIVVDGSGLDEALVAACADLLGEDVLHAVLATPQTGPACHADTAALTADPASAGTPLAGVELTTADDGELLVTSPLAADGALGGPVARDGWPPAPEWTGALVPTGVHGTVAADGAVALAG